MPGEIETFLDQGAFSSCAQPSPRGGRCETVGRQGWMKVAGAFLGRPRELRTCHNMAHNIGGVEQACEKSVAELADNQPERRSRTRVDFVATD
jgi:hypothetical protein